jgi:hypothetical protein
VNFNSIMIGSQDPKRVPGAAIATLADPDDNYFQLMSPMGPDQATT